MRPRFTTGTVHCKASSPRRATSRSASGWRRNCSRHCVNLIALPSKLSSTCRSGEVSLRVEPDENPSVPTALRFTISDTGIGISDEKLGQVFERFTQADSYTTRRFGGAGLGLTVSKRLGELM